MSRYQTITFRCKEETYDKLEQFALRHGIDRTSAIKLALHYYLNLKLIQEPQAPQEATGKESSPLTMEAGCASIAATHHEA